LGFFLTRVNKFTKQVNRHISAYSKEEMEQRKNKTMAEEIKSSKAVIFPQMFSFFYEDSRFLEKPLEIMEPVITLARAVVLHYLIFLFGGGGHFQLVLVFLIEVLYAYYVLKTRQKYNKTDNRMDIFNRLAFPLFVLVKIGASVAMAEERRQELMGTVVLSLFLAIVAANTLYYFCKSVYILGRAIKEWRKRATLEEEKTKKVNKTAAAEKKTEMPVLDNLQRGDQELSVDSKHHLKNRDQPYSPGAQEKAHPDPVEGQR